MESLHDRVVQNIQSDQHFSSLKVVCIKFKFPNWHSFFGLKNQLCHRITIMGYGTTFRLFRKQLIFILSALNIAIMKVSFSSYICWNSTFFDWILQFLMKFYNFWINSTIVDKFYNFLIKFYDFWLNSTNLS